MASAGTRHQGAVDCSSADKAASYPQAAAAQHKPRATARNSSSPAHSADTPSEIATDTAHTAPEGVLTSSSPPAVSSAAATGLNSISTGDGRTPGNSAALNAAAAALTAAGGGPCASPGLQEPSACASAPPTPAPTPAAGLAVKLPGAAGGCCSPARPVSPFAAMAGTAMHAGLDRTPAATCHVRVVSIPAGLPPIRTSPEGQPLRLLVPDSARAPCQPAHPSSQQALPYSSLLRSAGGWDGNKAAPAAATAAETAVTHSAAPQPTGVVTAAGVGGIAAAAADAAVAAAGLTGGEAHGTGSNKAGGNAAAMQFAGAADPASHSITGHPGGTAPAAAAGMKRAASFSDSEQQPALKRQVVELTAVVLAAAAGGAAGAAPGGSEQQSVQQEQQRLLAWVDASCSTAILTASGGSAEQHPAASTGHHEHQPGQFLHQQHTEEQHQEHGEVFIGDQNLSTALALLSGAPGQAPSALQRDLLGYAWGVLGCADPRTLLLGWHLHLRVLANRHHLQERMQQEDSGLTQDNSERVLAVYCCWQAALMLERDSLQPPEFADAMGLQMQQLQHLQNAVMTVLVWGGFDSYLDAAQGVQAAAGGI